MLNWARRKAVECLTEPVTCLPTLKPSRIRIKHYKSDFKSPFNILDDRWRRLHGYGRRNIVTQTSVKQSSVAPSKMLTGNWSDLLHSNELRKLVQMNQSSKAAALFLKILTPSPRDIANWFKALEGLNVPTPAITYFKKHTSDSKQISAKVMDILLLHTAVTSNDFHLFNETWRRLQSALLHSTDTSDAQLALHSFFPDMSSLLSPFINRVDHEQVALVVFQASKIGLKLDSQILHAWLFKPYLKSSRTILKYHLKHIKPTLYSKSHQETILETYLPVLNFQNGSNYFLPNVPSTSLNSPEEVVSAIRDPFNHDDIKLIISICILADVIDCENQNLIFELKKIIATSNASGRPFQFINPSHHPELIAKLKYQGWTLTENKYGDIISSIDITNLEFNNLASTDFSASLRWYTQSNNYEQCESIMDEVIKRKIMLEGDSNVRIYATNSNKLRNLIWGFSRELPSQWHPIATKFTFHCPWWTGYVEDGIIKVPKAAVLDWFYFLSSLLAETNLTTLIALKNHVRLHSYRFPIEFYMAFLCLASTNAIISAIEDILTAHAVAFTSLNPAFNRYNSYIKEHRENGNSEEGSVLYHEALKIQEQNFYCRNFVCDVSASHPRATDPYIYIENHVKLEKQKLAPFNLSGEEQARAVLPKYLLDFSAFKPILNWCTIHFILNLFNGLLPASRGVTLLLDAKSPVYDVKKLYELGNSSSNALPAIKYHSTSLVHFTDWVLQSST